MVVVVVVVEMGAKAHTQGVGEGGGGGGELVPGPRCPRCPRVAVLPCCRVAVLPPRVPTLAACAMAGSAAQSSSKLRPGPTGNTSPAACTEEGK